MEDWKKKIIGALGIPSLYMATGPKRAVEMGTDAAKSAISGATLPGDVVRGTADPNDMKRVMDLTGLVATGGLANSARPGMENTLGIFGGRRAKLPSSFGAEGVRAERALDRGKDPSEVWGDSGWGREPLSWGGKPFFEFDDSQMNLNPDWAKIQEQKGGYLGDIIEYPQLYSAYPGLDKVGLWNSYDVSKLLGLPNIGQDYGGLSFLSGSQRRFALSDQGVWANPSPPNMLGIPTPPKIEDARSTWLHELNHLVNNLESFGNHRGDYKLPQNPSQEMLTEEYLRRPNEGGPIGSFTVESRRGLDETERMMSYPSSNSHYDFNETWQPYGAKQPELTSAKPPPAGTVDELWDDDPFFGEGKRRGVTLWSIPRRR